MTERIPCKTEGCRATILPATAAKTGGFCMPCHQWQARQKEQAYIEQHRRTVNLYEGLTDRVDILKLMHAPRRYDPLIQYVPYPLSKEELYVSLTGEEANRMLEYAVELLGADDQDTGMDILSSLVCYRNENIAGCLPILLELGVYDPRWYSRMRCLNSGICCLNRWKGMTETGIRFCWAWPGLATP